MGSHNLSNVTQAISINSAKNEASVSRVWEAWHRVEWVLLIANIVFSSTFLTSMLIIIIVNKDLRRILFLILAWLIWHIPFYTYYNRFDIVFTCQIHFKGANFLNDPKERLLAAMELAITLEEWQAAASQLDIMTRADIWREVNETDLYEWKAVNDYLEKLRVARRNKDIPTLMFLLRLCVARDFCGISNPRLFRKAHMGTKFLVEMFTDELCDCLRVVSNPVWSIINQSQQSLSSSQDDGSTSSSSRTGFSAVITASAGIGIPRPASSGTIYSDTSTQTGKTELSWDLCSCMSGLGREKIDKITKDNLTGTKFYCQKAALQCFSMVNPKTFDQINLHGLFTPINSPNGPLVRNSLKRSCDGFDSNNVIKFLATLRLSVGRTALCLSGGGSLAMYHIGVVRALLSMNCLPRVISGTSGGSIVAGVLALYNDDVLLKDYLTPDIVSRYGCRWFPPMSLQLRSFFFQGQMMEGKHFETTCRAYYSNYTFKEAFLRTGRSVSIVVTPASRGTGEALILNCINTPDVMIWSAVAASCALPGLLPPHELVAKSPEGKEVPYYPPGLKWIDGSISQDLPIKELASLFNVKQFIVSQVNPHHAPFVQSHTAGSRIMRLMEKLLILDIKHRYAKLAKFNMVPKIFGQDMSSFWMVQEIEGHITITPQAALIDWYRIVNQPTIEDMRDFLSKGEARTWPHLARIVRMVEQTLRECWTHVAKNYNYNFLDIDNPPSALLHRHPE